MARTRGISTKPLGFNSKRSALVTSYARAADPKNDLAQYHIKKSLPRTPRQIRRTGKAMKKMGASTGDLKVLAHHGTAAITPHGVGGIKPHHITGVPRVKPVKSTVRNTVRSVEHGVKIPHSMKAIRPGVPKIHAPKIHAPKMHVPRVHI